MKLSDLSPRHLECRSMGHAWTHVDDHGHMVAASNKYQIVRFWRDEECLRCNAERTREIDLSKSYRVDVRTTRMKYPEGYLVHGAKKRVTRGDALGTQYGRETWL